MASRMWEGNGTFLELALVLLDKPIALGRTAEIYAWEHGQILKLFRPQWGPDSAEHEARIGRTLHAAGLPVPDVGEIIHLSGRVGVVYKYIAGRTLLVAIRSSPGRVPSYAHAFARLHAEIHTQVLAELPSQRHRLEGRIRSVKCLPNEIKDTVLQILHTLPDGDRVCHGDFHPLNALVTKRGFIVIDWTDATRGNPLADVARTRLIFELAGLARLPLRVATVRAWFYRNYLKSYRQFAAFEEGEFADWHRVMAAARLAEEIPGELDTLLKFA